MGQGVFQECCTSQEFSIPQPSFINTLWCLCFNLFIYFKSGLFDSQNGILTGHTLRIPIRKRVRSISPPGRKATAGTQFQSNAGSQAQELLL